ncbi:MAG: DUF4399 domain-containing protein [Caldilineae bacterium]|nr:DUF4399 domain-containing protein [Caldilineae bacterium]
MSTIGRRAPALAALLLAAAMTGACAGEEADEGAAGDAAAPSVSFVDLTDGATLPASGEVCLEVANLTIEPSGEVVAGAGHHHILIDPSADELSGYSEGTLTDPLPKDETHVHMGDGSACTTLTLTPGEHTLMAVVGDGEHTPLSPPVVATVKVNVGE